MSNKTVFEQIKKQNGEHFAKTIRAYDNGIFDIPNIVDVVKYAGREAEPIMAYLESLKKIEVEAQAVYKDPITLLAEAGYDAYYADTLEKQNAIEKYYAPWEKICTFNDPTRFQRFYIINCVSKKVDEIQRENFFGYEKREDEYGTSVLSIQILKTGGFISIKNRYNHSVENPDNTLDSNPDNIIQGLSGSLRHYFNVDFSSPKVDTPKNFIIVNHQLVHFYKEIDGVYLGENFYVKNGEIHLIDKDKEILMDHFVLDLQNKTVKNLANNNDCFPDIFTEEIKNKNVQITKDKKGHHIIIIDPQNKTQKQEIACVQDRQITFLNLPTTKKIGDNFLRHNKGLEKIHIPFLEEVGDSFLYENEKLFELYAPILKKTRDSFLHSNEGITEFDASYLKEVGDFFLPYNTKLARINIPILEKTGDYFLYSNEGLTEFNAPSLKEMGSNALNLNKKISQMNIPVLEKVRDYFFADNEELTEIYAPALKEIGHSFLCYNGKLKILDAPLLERAMACFLSYNKKYKTNAPALIKKLPVERILKKKLVASKKRAQDFLIFKATEKKRN